MRSHEEFTWDEIIFNKGSDIPNLLLSVNKYIYRQEKKITPTEMWVLLLLFSYWHKENEYPLPSKSILAKAMCLSPRQIQRTLSQLEEKGYISKISRYEKNARSTNGYDLSGIIGLLKKIEVDKSPIDIAA